MFYYEIGRERQLFVDDMLVAETHGLEKVLHQPVKFEGNPVLRGDHPLENDYACLHGSVLFDEGDGLFKAWYLTQAGIAYATSEDGLSWRKPELDVFPIDGRKSHIVYRGAHPEELGPGAWKVDGVAVMIDPNDEPGRRFKMFSFQVHLAKKVRKKDPYNTYGYFLAASPDGIYWTGPAEPAISQHEDPHMSDACSRMLDPLKRRFIAFTKRHQPCPNGIGDQDTMLRVRGIAFSSDWEHWTAPVMGADYARTHQGLGRLAKVFDYACRTFFHVHQMEKDAKKVGRNGKDEAYHFFEDTDLGSQPETFFGVHPYIVAQQRQEEILLPYLKDWDRDGILKHSKGYFNAPGEGFHVPAGCLHAPGTALTLELQEPSDVFAVFQPVAGGIRFSKDLLWKDVAEEDRARDGEKTVLDHVDWTLCGDPYFYENRHTAPLPTRQPEQPGAREEWIFYNTTKFSGKKTTVKPGCSFHSVDSGVYNLFVWRGRGTAGGHDVEGGNFGLDELLVTHDKATRGFTIENAGTRDLVLFKFFGPDINPDVPRIQQYPPR